MTRYALIRNSDGAELCVFEADTVDDEPGGVYFSRVVEVRRRATRTDHDLRATAYQGREFARFACAKCDMNVIVPWSTGCAEVDKLAVTLLEAHRVLSEEPSMSVCLGDAVRAF